MSDDDGVRVTEAGVVRFLPGHDEEAWEVAREMLAKSGSVKVVRWRWNDWERKERVDE